MPQGRVLAIITVFLVCSASCQSQNSTSVSQQPASSTPLESVTPLREVDRKFLTFLAGKDVSQFDGHEGLLLSLDDGVKSGLLEDSFSDESVLRTIMFNASWRFVDLSLLKEKEGLKESYSSLLLPLNPSKSAQIKLSRLVEMGRVFGEGLDILIKAGLPDDVKIAKKLVYQASISFLLPNNIGAKVSLLLPVDFFIGEGAPTLDDILKDAGSLGNQIWNDIPFTTMKMWYEAGRRFQGNNVSDMTSKASLHPLISGATDKDILEDWFDVWNEKRHNDTINFLKSSIQYLRPSQTQLFMAPFGDNIRQFADTAMLLEKVDVLQLTRVGWSNLPDDRMVDRTKMLLVAIQSGYDVSKLNLASDPTMLGLRFPLEIQFAIDNGSLTVNATSLKMASSLELSRGQTAVLLEGYLAHVVNKSNSASDSGRDLRKIPGELWYALPFNFILALNSNSDVITKKLELVIKRYYHKLLPSQKLAVFWKSSRSPRNPAMDGLVDILDKVLDIKPVSQTSSSSLLNYVAPAVFKATSSRDEGMVRRMCIEGKISPLEVIDKIAEYNNFLSIEELGKIKILPLSVRQCFKDLLQEYLEIKASIYPGSSEMRNLTFAEQMAIQGEFLTYLLPDVVKPEIVRLIGQVPVPKLLPLATFEALESVASKFVDRAGFLDFTKISMLGSLAFFVGEKVSDEKNEDIRLFLSSLEDLSKCLCLPEKHRAVWSGIIVTVYGSPEKWSMSDLIELGDLVTVLDPEHIFKINKEAVRRAAPYLIKNSCLPKVYEVFPGFSTPKSFEKVCDFKSNGSMSTKSYKRILLEATFTNLDLVFNLPNDGNVDDVEKVITEIKAQNVTDNLSEEVKNARKVFYQMVPKLIEEKFKRMQLSREQLRRWKELQDKYEVNIRQTVSKVFEVRLDEVPFSKNNISKFIEDVIDNFPEIAVRTFSNRVNDIYSEHVEELSELIEVSEKDLNISRSTFCRIVNCLDRKGFKEFIRPLTFDPDFDVNTFFTLKTPALRSNNSLCFGLSFAMFAGAAINVSDLESWPNWELYKCVETFGLLDIDEQSKMDIWKVLHKRIGNMIMSSTGVVQGGSMLLMGSLISAVAKDMPEKLEYEKSMAIESLSVLGSMDLDQDLVTNVATQYVKMRNFSDKAEVTSKNILEFASLGNLFCGVPLGIANKILNEARKLQVPIKLFGATITSCKNHQILTLLASKIDKSVKDWTLTDVAVNGVILAGLKPASLKELEPKNFWMISPSTFSHLKPGHFASLSPDQISNFSLEAVAMLRRTQLSLNKGFKLTKNQLSSFPKGSPGDGVISQYSDGVLGPEHVEGKLMDFSRMNDIGKEAILRPPLIDRSDTVVPGGEGEDDDGRSSAGRVIQTTIIYVLTIIVYLYLLFCCTE